MSASPSTGDGLIERLLKREHYFRNASEGEYDANLLMKARFEIEALLDLARNQADTIQTLQTERDAALHPRTASDLAVIIRNWLDADDATHWGTFEKRLDAALNSSPNTSGEEK